MQRDSNKNECQKFFLGGKGGRCVGLTTLPSSCADYLEIWNPQGLLYLYEDPPHKKLKKIMGWKRLAKVRHNPVLQNDVSLWRDNSRG